MPPPPPLLHGRALAAIAQARGAAAAVAEALAAAALAPQALATAYTAALDHADDADCGADARRLLALARSALDSLNAASRTGCAEASTYLTSTLHADGLLALIFRDEREARAAAEKNLCEETVAEVERAASRAALTVTRPAKYGEVIRSVFTRPDGTPLRSFVLFGPHDAPLLDSFVETFEADTAPRAVFGLYADSNASSPGAASSYAAAESAASERDRLLNRLLASTSVTYIACLTVSMQNIALGSIPASRIVRMRAAAATTVFSQRELEGLFRTFGRDQLGVAVLASLAVISAASPVFESLLSPEVDGVARLLAALSSESLDDPSINGCLVVLSYACGHSARFAQALVDKGAFALLQPVLRRDDPVMVVRAAFAVASIAAAGGGAAAEPLRRSGVLDVMTAALRPIIVGSIIIPGFMSVVTPVVIRLLQADMPPALHLATLHRLGAALTGTTAVAAAATTIPLLLALRNCAAAHDVHISAAARYVLKELQQPLIAPPRASPESDPLTTIKKLTSGSKPSKVELYSLGLRLVAADIHSEAGALSPDSPLATTTPKSDDDGSGAGAGAGAGSSLGPAGEEQELTRSMLAGLLGRPSVPLDAAWQAFMSDKITEASLMQIFEAELAAGGSPRPDDPVVPPADERHGRSQSLPPAPRPRLFSGGAPLRLLPTIPGSPTLASAAAPPGPLPPFLPLD